MKIEYKLWTCLVCKKSVQITKADELYMPRWINVRTEGSSSSDNDPSYDSSVCGTECLSNAGNVIHELIYKKEGYLIQKKKEIVATICDRCGKVAKENILNLICGPGPLKEWTRATRGGAELDFCSTDCKNEHFCKPEESVFFGLKFPTPWHKQKRLLIAIDALDFRKSIRAKEPPLLFRNLKGKERNHEKPCQ